MALLGLLGSAFAVPVGAWLAGAVAASGGAVVAVRALRDSQATAFRLLLGSGAVVYGAGQVLMGVRVAGGDATFPTTGDLVSTLSVPLAVAGLATLPRRSGELHGGPRLALEALTLGSVGAMLLWRLAFEDVLVPDLSAGDAAAVLILLADLSVLALVLIAAVRELDRGLILSFLGMACYVSADLVTMHAVVQPGGVWPWPAMALACVAWPLIIAGLLRIAAAPPQLAEADVPRAESRRTATMAVLLAVLLGAFVVALLPDPRLHRVEVLLAVVLVLAVSASEVVRGRQGRLLLQQIRAQAMADPLTGLGNRRALTEALETGSGRRSVLTLDLDGFKQVNSLLGHAVGDVLLVGVARRLERVCGEACARAFRLGGDEFAVVADVDLTRAERLGCVLVEAVVDVWQDVPAAGAVDLSASVGVAERVADDDPLLALTASGAALRVAKATGRGCVVGFTDVLAAAEERRGRVEKRLRRALRHGDIEMHYQPVVNLESGALMGLEALARWHDDELGQVPPQEFVAVAEQSGLMLELGAGALRMAIEAMAASGAAAAGLNVGVNVSAIELRSSTYAHEVLRLLHLNDVQPQRLVLEVTESLFVAEDDPAIRTLQALADVGVAVAIDDFGTGYSSLSYLHRLPVHIVKIDRSLTAQLDDPRIRAVTGAVVEIGRALGLDIVVEGIETEAMAAASRSLGARIAQGWLFSHPVPAQDVPGLLTRAWAAAPSRSTSPGADRGRAHLAT